MTAPEGIECDRCHWIDISGINPGAVIAGIFNAKRKESIKTGWCKAMTPEEGSEWYEHAEESGGSFPGFKHLDYVDFTAFKAFINEHWLEASFIAKEHSDDVVAALRAKEGAMSASVVDFADALSPCPECGAEAYLWASPRGSMATRYRCGHTSAALRETVEDLVRQFAHEVVRDSVPCLSTGGLSALEDAFAVLGWDDPHPCPEGACEHPACAEWATCGTSTTDGYRRLCGAHYRELRTTP